MKFNEIIPDLEAGKPIRRRSWPANMRFNKNDNFKLSMSDVIADVDDWEIYVEPPYDEFLEEMKRYLYDELEFHIKPEHYNENMKNYLEIHKNRTDAINDDFRENKKSL